LLGGIIDGKIRFLIRSGNGFNICEFLSGGTIVNETFGFSFKMWILAKKAIMDEKHWSFVMES